MKNSRFTVSVPGKVFLAGEHAAVYGAPAVLAAVSLRCKVTVKLKAQNSKLKATTKNLKLNIKDKNLDNPLGLLRLAVKECLLVKPSLQNKSIELEIDSQIPIGRGLGSSAAMATAVATALLGKGLEKEADQAVLAVEKVQHGIPSGADQAAAKMGGFIGFCKKSEGFEVKQLRVRGWTPKVVLIDSGKPAESTAEMVEGVARKFKTQNSKLKTIFKRIGSISNEWERALCLKAKRQALNAKYLLLLKKNQRFLEELGVVGEKAKGIVREVEKNGGAVKVCGAGGVKEGSGVMLAFHEDKKKLADLIMRERWRKYEIELGVEGVITQITNY